MSTKKIAKKGIMITFMMIMMPDKSLSFAYVKKSDNLKNFPWFRTLGSLQNHDMGGLFSL